MANLMRLQNKLYLLMIITTEFLQFVVQDFNLELQLM